MIDKEKDVLPCLRRVSPLRVSDAPLLAAVALGLYGIFDEGSVRLCRDEGLKTDCPSKPILSPDQLENGSTSLRLGLPESEYLPPRLPCFPMGGSSWGVERSSVAAKSSNTCSLLARLGS